MKQNVKNSFDNKIQKVIKITCLTNPVLKLMIGKKKKKKKKKYPSDLEFPLKMSINANDELRLTC